LRRGTEALERGKIGRAVDLLEQARRLDPHNLDLALNLGGAYILSKKFSKAVAVLEPLSEHDAENPMVWTNLGAAYLGNPVLASDAHQRRAIDAFKQALALNPQTPNVAYNLGLIFRDRGDVDRALYWFWRAVETDPDDRDARSYIKKLTRAGDASSRRADGS
jgi:tetratricopeptide (TPR) repeat protein